MFKIALLCALVVCSQAAPTETSHDENVTISSLAPSMKDDLPVHSIKTISNEKREKREDRLESSSADNKRTPLQSQSDYQENKPPTFVHPVPVDQIIKNSNASPQIHSAKHLEEETEESHPVEVDSKAANEEETEEEPQKPKVVSYKHA